MSDENAFWSRLEAASRIEDHATERYPLRVGGRREREEFALAGSLPSSPHGGRSGQTLEEEAASEEPGSSYRQDPLGVGGGGPTSAAPPTLEVDARGGGDGVFTRRSLDSYTPLRRRSADTPPREAGERWEAPVTERHAQLQASLAAARRRQDHYERQDCLSGAGRVVGEADEEQQEEILSLSTFTQPGDGFFIEETTQVQLPPPSCGDGVVTACMGGQRACQSDPEPPGSTANGECALQ